MNAETFRERLRQNQRPVVVEVWAPWCLPCRTISPTLERLSQQYAGKVDLWKINADEEAELVRSLGILAIPTILVYHGGQEITRRIGAQSPTALNALFEAALTSTPPILGSLTPVERLLRLIAALSLIALGWLSASSPLLYLVGIILLFSAIYDRCPIWRALAPRLKKALLRFVSNKHGQSTLN